ncbi:MAG TPA: DUF2911 domain-containing protein [Gemmatimonadales bacterium]
MRPSVIVLLGVVLAPSMALGQQSYGFIARLGRDTLVVERVTRSANRLEGQVVSRTPRVVMRHYVADLAPDGTVRRIGVSVRTPNPAPNAPREQHVTVEFGRDTLPVTIRIGDSTTTLRVAARGLAMPWIVYGYGTYEQIFMAARKRGGDSVAVTGYQPGGRNIAPTYVRRQGSDSVALGFFGDAVVARVDREGRLLGLNAEGTTVKVRVERLNDVDVQGIGQRFAATEASTGAPAALSLRDTVRASVSGSDLLLDYGRPARRGRQIFGQLVPFDKVWRTGANAATQFSTTRDLEFEGGLVVPAGKYTLWTLPTTSGVSFIVNKQTGQWGTVYDSAQDLGRVPLRVEKVDQPLEIFTMLVEPGTAGGRVVMEWDTTRWIASFKVR